MRRILEHRQNTACWSLIPKKNTLPTALDESFSHLQLQELSDVGSSMPESCKRLPQQCVKSLSDLDQITDKIRCCPSFCCSTPWSHIAMAPLLVATVGLASSVLLYLLPSAAAESYPIQQHAWYKDFYPQPEEYCFNGCDTSEMSSYFVHRYCSDLP